MNKLNGRPLREYTLEELTKTFNELFFYASDDLLRDILEAIKMREQFEKR